MRAGTLDRRVTLQHATLAEDAHGQQVPTYADYATVWAQRLDTTARERMASQQMISERTCKFRLRYRSDVLPTDRLVCDGVAYNIAPPAELGRREGLEILATAVGE